MKRIYLCLLISIFACGTIFADANFVSAFSMLNTADVQTNITTTYYADTTIPINNIGCISRVSLNGKSILNIVIHH